MRKSQIDEISNLLLSYSAGNYHVKGEISEHADEIDMIILGINMLGEELESSNVSKDYFTSIFNSVTDLVLVVNESGNIIEVNQSAVLKLEYSKRTLVSSDFEKLLKDPNSNLFENIKSKLSKENNRFVIECQLLTKSGNIVFGLFTCAMIFDHLGVFDGYLISIKDISEQKENEKLILTTILSTQIAEQKRMADDLHDSLGQELSMAQLMLSNINKFKIDNSEFSNLVALCDEILGNSIKRLREICFDLMPNVLVKGGVELAVETLVGKLNKIEQFKIDFVSTENFPRLIAELEVVIYRIIQEFINNMTKHSNATRLNIHLVENDSTIEFVLKENGQGFDLKKLENIGENRGLSNIKTKVIAYNGKFKYNSEIGKGTELWVEFPK